MRCLACTTGKLEITNSRKHATEPRVWRRRACTNCGFIFTTHELPDYTGAFTVGNGKHRKDQIPFNKAELLRDLFLAGSHMPKQDALIWLADTIASKAFRAAAESIGTYKKSAKKTSLPVPVIDNAAYQQLVLDTLTAYDALLAANYKARLSLSYR